MTTYTPGYLDVVDGDGVVRRLKGFWTDAATPEFVSEHRPTQLMDLFSGELWKSGVQSFNVATSVAYAAPTSTAPGDVMGDNTTAGSVTILEFDVPPVDALDTVAAGEISLLRVEMAGQKSATLRAHLYKGTSTQKPALTNGDNGALLVSNHTIARYLGYIDVTLQPGPGGAAVGFNDITRPDYSLVKSGGATNEKIYLVFEVLTAFTPTAAQTLTAQLTTRRTR